MAAYKVEICGVNTSTLPILKEEEKASLFEKIRQGDLAARETYIKGNLRLVLSIIRRFAASNENVDEIIFVTKYDKIIDNLKNKDIKVVKNNNSEFGISQSIKLGVSNSSNNIYMFIVCDQPYIKKETIDKFIK